MNAVLCVVAMPEEAAHLDLPTSWEILVTGPGKVDAAVGLSRRLQSRRDGAVAVLNLGTAGSPTALPGGVYAVAEAEQWDYPAELLQQLTGRGGFGTPLPLHVPAPFAGRAHRCATADRFLDDGAIATGLAARGIDLVDMETYAYASAAAAHGVRFTSLRYVTDAADERAARDWVANLEVAGAALSAAARLVAESPAVP